MICAKHLTPAPSSIFSVVGVIFVQRYVTALKNLAVKSVLILYILKLSVVNTPRYVLRLESGPKQAILTKTRDSYQNIRDSHENKGNSYQK